MSTTFTKESEVIRQWYVVDAAGKPAGRLAVDIVRLLRGKHKATYTPHVDAGDFVVVVNAEKVALTGSKETKKVYKHYTGYPSGLREYTAATVRAKHPTRILSQAVWGMLPHGRLGRRMYRRLRLYTGPEHPHAAQRPTEVAG
jgi:large subunit ribosomal protein L13